MAHVRMDRCLWGQQQGMRVSALLQFRSNMSDCAVIILKPKVMPLFDGLKLWCTVILAELGIGFLCCHLMLS